MNSDQKVVATLGLVLFVLVLWTSYKPGLKAILFGSTTPVPWGGATMSAFSTPTDTTTPTTTTTVATNTAPTNTLNFSGTGVQA